jgi:hypothetical protein
VGERSFPVSLLVPSRPSLFRSDPRADYPLCSMEAVAGLRQTEPSRFGAARYRFGRRAVASRYPEHCAPWTCRTGVRRRTGPAGARQNRAGRVRPPRGVGAVMTLLHGSPAHRTTGRKSPRPGRALSAHGARPAGLRRIHQAARAPLLASLMRAPEASVGVRWGRNASRQIRVYRLCGADFGSGPRCRRRDSNPRHADYDSAALTD